MTVDAILQELQSLGTASVRKVLLNHGVDEPCYGVKIGDLKKLEKRIKKDYRLTLDLWETGVHDARYLAGLIADDARMTTADLDRWAGQASRMLAGTAVAWVATGSPHGFSLARRWIDSEADLVAVAGWATWSGLVAVTADEKLDLAEIKSLLQRIRRSIHSAPNDVRYHMNSFVICVGCYVSSLTETALKTGEAIGAVEVDMGATACEVPLATDYIRKVEARGTIGKKRKTVKC